MSRSERPAAASPERRPTPRERLAPGGARYGRYLGLAGLLALALITLNTLLGASRGAAGIAAGERVPPFAVPLALGTLNGDANIATRANEGPAGSRPACTVRGPQILNVCELYEQGPVVLALFVDADSCPAVLDDLQALVGEFPGVRFAAVAIKGERGPLRTLVRTHRLTLPVGIDSDGALAALYRVGSCPQVTFAYPGGVAQGRALLTRPSPAALRERVAQLVAGARARGWRPA